ncbi:MAG: FixH family protein, partial [Gammaproteobacteria bacterium]
ADIKVDGGMPEHNHGFPTRPQVTKNLGDGCYLLEGMKFHMGGLWTISISITDNNVSDNVTFDLNL